jgi:photosystem II stability/assembly factor-like uncharacterized protein
LIFGDIENCVSRWRSFMKLKTIILALFIALGSLNIFANVTSETAKFNTWQVVGPNGGDIRALAIDPKNKNRIFATTLDSQIYLSADAGKTWRFMATLNRPNITIDNIIIDSSDSNNVFVAGHRHREDGGFWYSKDGGQTWKESKDVKGEGLNALTQSSLNPKMLVAGSYAKVFVSYNSGEDWKLLENIQPFANLIVDSAAIDPRDTNTIFIGTSWRAYKSKDAGKTWKLIKDGMIDDSDVFNVEIDDKNPDHIIASACSGIYESWNSGELWKKIQGIPSQSRRTRAITLNPANNGGLYAGTTNGFWMSSDVGKTWSLTTQRELEVNSIAVHSDEPNKIYIATNNYGLMVSEDGGKNFKIMNGNFTSRFILNVTPDIQKPNRIYATTNNTGTGGGFIFISDDNGQTWVPSNKNLSVIITSPLSILQDSLNQNTIYLGTNNGIYRSLDRGVTWNQVKGTASSTPIKKTVKGKTASKKPTTSSNVKSGISRVSSVSGRIVSLAYANDGKNSIFAASTSGLYRSNNVTVGWDSFNFGAGIDKNVISVATSALKPNRIFAGTTKSGLLISEDNGLTWKTSSVIPTITPINVIEIDPTNANTIYVGTTNSVYISRDGGQNWFRAKTPSGEYKSIAINPTNPNEIVVGNASTNNGGLYQSLDAGENWRQIDKDVNLPTKRVWALAFDSKNSNRLYVGTNSSGIYIIERSSETAATTDTFSRPRIVSNQ